MTMRLVPETATEEMVDGPVEGSSVGLSCADAEEVWSAFLRAAPSRGQASRGIIAAMSASLAKNG